MDEFFLDIVYKNKTVRFKVVNPEAPLSTLMNNLRYADELVAEINQLSYLADAMAVIPSKTLALYHPLAQRLLSNNRKWCIIFHKTEKYVFVHKIIPSSAVIW